MSEWDLVFWFLMFYLLVSLSSTGCLLYYLVINVQIIYFPLCLRAGRMYLYHPYFYSLLSCVFSFLLVPSPSLPNKCMRNLPQEGDQQICNMMRANVLISVFRVGLFFFWVLPLDLLSLCLCFLYAQMHVPTHGQSCWQLNTFQTTRDEVTGFCPFAYDDMSTEANFFRFWEMIFHYSVVSVLFWIISILQMRRVELQVFRTLALTFGCIRTLLQAQNTSLIRVQLSLISYTVFGLIWIVLYWFTGIWSVVLNCNYSFPKLVSLLWVFGCIDNKLPLCNSLPVYFIEPHCYAFGLCSFAHAWHHQMPVTAHIGLGQCEECGYCVHLRIRLLLWLLLGTVCWASDCLAYGWVCVVPSTSFFIY